MDKGGYIRCNWSGHIRNTGCGTNFRSTMGTLCGEKMREMYPGKKGKIAAVIVFIEEILPGTDIIPTFTLMWLYTFVWSKEKSANPREIIIEAEII